MTVESIAAIAPSVLPAVQPIVSDAVPASTGDFGSMIAGGLANLQALQTRSDNLALQAATGTLNDVHDYMIAGTEASIATQLTVAVRDKALDAFNEIMRMQA